MQQQMFTWYFIYYLKYIKIHLEIKGNNDKENLNQDKMYTVNASESWMWNRDIKGTSTLFPASGNADRQGIEDGVWYVCWGIECKSWDVISETTLGGTVRCSGHHTTGL